MNLSGRRILGFAFGLGLTVLPVAGMRADEPREERPGAGTAESKDADAPQPPVKSRYDLPDGGVKELLAFIQAIRAFEPTTVAETLERRQKLYAATEAALERIDKIATDEDKKLKGYDEAHGMLLRFRTAIYGNGPRAGTPEAKRKLLDDIKTTLAASAKPSEHAVAAAKTVATTLEYGGRPELAVEVYRDCGTILAKSADEATAVVGAKMLGAAQRLGLVGKPLELQGTLVDGAAFDWAKYRGKVVLVDFWATWCGPCRAEMPNVQRNFDQYHDRGFEVVGVSLDDDRDALEKFLEREPHPWPVLHNGGFDENPLATRYGIMGIPTMILVDRQGNVVSIRARGKKLDEQLAKLLGPANDAAKPAEAKTAADK